MAGTTATPPPVDTDVELQAVEVEEIPADLVAENRPPVVDPVTLPDYPPREIRRPSLVGNLIYLAFVGVLAMWGTFLVLYLLKEYLGIDIFPGVSVSRHLGL
jgi:hypothetical protein